MSPAPGQPGKRRKSRGGAPDGRFRGRGGRIGAVRVLGPSSALIAILALAACRGEPTRATPVAEAAPAEVAAAPAAQPRAAPGPLAPLVGTCAAAASHPAGDDAWLDALLDEAGRRLEAGAWGDAFTCADMAADRAPRSIEAHHLRGAALAGAGRDEAAAVAYGLALALDPEDPETLRAVADFYINVTSLKSRDSTVLGLELARRGTARATARRRGQADLRGQLALLEAQACNDLGRSEEAVERAAVALRFDSELVDAIHEHGVALFNLGRAEEAIAEFTRVLEVQPDDAYAHNLMGLSLELLGRHDLAEVHLARARALAPDEFAPPVLIGAEEMHAEVARVLAALPPAQQARAAQVPIEIADMPDPADLAGGEHRFPPTILGLYRGLPLGEAAPPGEATPPRAILLYRRNLARVVRTRAELSQQIERTLLHELGHLDGLDEDDLRRRDLE